jgi:N-methylhydantoinase A
LPATGLLGGELPLDMAATREALATLSQDLSPHAPGAQMDLEEMALGILQVVNAEMERAIRVMSVERGHDPREYVLLSFGGAGGVHACDLARSLNVGRVLIPMAASTLSALGMLTANVFLDYIQTVMCPGETPFEELERRFVPMVEQAQEDLETQQVPVPARHVHCEVDLRYQGQSFELTVPFSSDFQTAFHEQHARRYGHQDETASLEIVNLRVRAIGDVSPPKIETQDPGPADSSEAVCHERRLVFASGSRTVPFYDRRRLQPGHHIPGPAVIFQDDTTILLSETDDAHVDAWHNVRVTIGEARAESR